MNVTPFKLRPVYKDYLWGGTRLKTGYGKHTGLPILAESWELSAHPAGVSTISSGAFSGMAFPDYLKKHPEAINNVQEFPILIKLIDAQQNLSVQVHPDDTYARCHGELCGKNEMWVVLESEPDASLFMGFQHSVTHDEFLRRIYDGTLTDILNSIKVKEGDVFFIPSGTIHAIGKGIVIAEVQQSSNATYRVFDYGRLDVNGNPRELHIQQALDVTNLCASHNSLPGACTLLSEPGIQVERLVKCVFFTVDRLRLRLSHSYRISSNTFHALLCIDGKGVLSCGNETLGFAKGDSLFIPADSPESTVIGNCSILCASE